LDIPLGASCIVINSLPHMKALMRFSGWLRALKASLMRADSEGVRRRMAVERSQQASEKARTSAVE